MEDGATQSGMDEAHQIALCVAMLDRSQRALAVKTPDLVQDGLEANSETNCARAVPGLLDSAAQARPPSNAVRDVSVLAYPIVESPSLSWYCSPHERVRRFMDATRHRGYRGRETLWIAGRAHVYLR